nr:hypothetical protein BaRGS_032567 [Batillaria attramentaria]
MVTLKIQMRMTKMKMMMMIEDFLLMSPFLDRFMSGDVTCLPFCFLSSGWVLGKGISWAATVEDFGDSLPRFALDFDGESESDPELLLDLDPDREDPLLLSLVSRLLRLEVGGAAGACACDDGGGSLGD